MVSTAKSQARKKAEQRRVDSASGTKVSGKEKNAPEQLVHGEGKVHETENMDREMDDLYDTETDNEQTEWRRHSDLDAPPARDGYVNRFIRIRLGTVRDTARLRNAIREGWRPVKASSLSDRSLPTTTLDQYGEVIGVEDLILCEMPIHMHKQRQKHFREKQQRQNRAIERQLKGVSRQDVSGFGPIQATRHSSVTAAPQRRVEVADDD
jgi:hypothetical protein